jgi:hypothetical protein
MSSYIHTSVLGTQEPELHDTSIQVMAARLHPNKRKHLLAKYKAGALN